MAKNALQFATWIETEPPGAEVVLSNGMRASTPAAFKLPRKKDVVVRIEKEGYEPIEVNVSSQVSGAGGAGMAGNALIGGLIGAAVDVGSGAMNDLRPNPVKVNLVPLAANVDGRRLPAAERLRQLKELFDSGEISEEDYQAKRNEILSEI